LQQPQLSSYHNLLKVQKVKGLNESLCSFLVGSNMLLTLVLSSTFFPDISETIGDFK